MMDQYTATFFDMDGVVVETASAWREIEETAILPAAVDEQPSENPIRALSVSDGYETLAAMEEVTLTVDRDEFTTLYDDHAPTVYERASLMDGFRSLLATLDSHGHAVGLVSASPRKWVEIVCDRFELWDEFETVVSATDLAGPSKPSPRPYEEAASQLGVEPDRALVIEDSPHGIEAGTAAGMECIALRGEGNRELDLSAADAVADDPDELSQLLCDRLENTKS